MPHPLTCISKKTNHFITTIRQLIRRTHSHVSQSMMRYQDALEEIEEYSESDLNDSLTYCSGKHKALLQCWRDSLKIPDLCWSKEEANKCCEDMKAGCDLIIKSWESLSKQCHEIKNCSRYADRCLSESEFIKTQLTPDLHDCTESISDIAQSLEKLNISTFLFCIRRNQLQLHDNTFVMLAEKTDNNDFLISSVEWVGLDLSMIKRDNVKLDKCHFTRCILGSDPWNNAQWEDVSFLECIGDLNFANSEINFKIEKSHASSISLKNTTATLTISNSSLVKFTSQDSSHLKSLSLIDSKCASMSIQNKGNERLVLRKSVCENLDLKGGKEAKSSLHLELEQTNVDNLNCNQMLVDSFLSTESSFNLRAIKSFFRSIQLIKSKAAASLEECIIHSLEGSHTRLYSESTLGEIKDQQWSESNAWIIAHETVNLSKRTRLISGSMEHHCFNKKTQCLIIIDSEDFILSSPDNASGYARIGRIAKQLSIDTHDKPFTAQSSLLGFYQSQLMCLLKHGVSPLKTHLLAAIQSRPALTIGTKKLTPYSVMLLFFKKRLNIAFNRKPVSTCFSLESMSASDNALVLDIIRLTDQKKPNPTSEERCHSSDLDSYFCQYILNLFSTYETMSKGALPAKQLMHAHHELRQIISSHLRKETINPRLLSQMIHRMIQHHVSRRLKSRSCSDYLINYLTQLATWYLSVRLKADQCANQLKISMNKHRSLRVIPPILSHINSTLSTDCPLIACQKVVADYRKSQTTLANQSFLGDVERKYLESMAMNTWESLSESTLNREHMSLNLEHIRLILSRYRPIFRCHRLGRHKLQVINQLVRLLRNMDQTPTQKASLLYTTISHLLGDNSSSGGHSILQVLRGFAWLSLGRSRPTKGYVTTLSLSKEILHQTLNEDPFHAASKKSCQKANSYFHGSMETVEQIRQLVSFKARNTLKRHLHFIKEKMAEKLNKKDLELEITEEHAINLEEQLAMSELLIKQIDQISNWNDKTINKAMQLWYCYESRENSSLKRIEKVRLSGGELLKHFSSENKRTRFSRSSDQADHIELSNLKQSSQVRESSEEILLGKLSPLLNKRSRRGHHHLFSMQAKKALQRGVAYNDMALTF